MIALWPIGDAIRLIQHPGVGWPLQLGGQVLVLSKLEGLRRGGIHAMRGGTQVRPSSWFLLGDTDGLLGFSGFQPGDSLITLFDHVLPATGIAFFRTHQSSRNISEGAQ